MCPSCRAFITDKDRICPYCGQQVGPRAIDVQQPGAILNPDCYEAHFTTVLILVINFRVVHQVLFLQRTIGETNAIGVLGAEMGSEYLPEGTNTGVSSLRDSCTAAGCI